MSTKAGQLQAYNEVHQYLQLCTDLVAKKSQKVSAELLLIRVDLVIRWRIQRPSGAIDWKAFREDLQHIQQSNRYGDDVIKQFYYGVAQYHCGDITDANATFARLKRLSIPALAPNSIRCYYLSVDGNPKRFQGTLERHHLVYYLSIPELNVSIPARARDAAGGPGATLHGYIAFAMNGPLVVFDKPSESESLLP